MKIMTQLLMLTTSMFVFAHKPVKVQSLEDAVAKYTQEEANFELWAGFGDVNFLKSLSVASLKETTLFKFEVKADWGPIHGLLIIKDQKVLGLEVLVFTEHEGAGVTMPAFRNQFKNLTKNNHEATQVKPLPKEPKTSLAIKEVVSVIFSQYPPNE